MLKAFPFKIQPNTPMTSTILDLSPCAPCPRGSISDSYSELGAKTKPRRHGEHGVRRCGVGLKFLASLFLFVATASHLQAEPDYDHVVVVMLENHGYAQILDCAGATYINKTLRAEGADMTAAYGIQHPSQPNYYWIFSGSNQGIMTDKAPRQAFCLTPNLHTALMARAKTFGGYVDAYPGKRKLYKNTTNYAVRHVPWLGFANIPSGITKPFSSFPTNAKGFASLPDISFVIPGLDHDMHNWNSTGEEVRNLAQSNIAIKNADAWLKENLDAYYQWAKKNNSLLILTTDENSTSDWITPPLKQRDAEGYTSPNLGPNPEGSSGPNQITIIFAGAHVIPGPNATRMTNVNVLRTIESIFDLDSSGDQAPLATSADINNDAVSDIFLE